MKHWLKNMYRYLLSQITVQLCVIFSSREIFTAKVVTLGVKNKATELKPVSGRNAENYLFQQQNKKGE